MANKYTQVKNFKFTGFISFKHENLVKSKDGSTWRQVGFSITDGNNSQFVMMSIFLVSLFAYIIYIEMLFSAKRHRYNA